MPRSPAPAGDFARTLRRFADGTSVCRQRTRALPARAPSGFSLRVLPAAQGDPGKKKSAAVLAAEAAERRCARSLLCFGSRSRARVTRRRADDQARRVGARDRADSAAGQGWPVSGTRPPAANPRQRARHPGALSLGYFSLGKQREVTRSPWMAREKAQGREAGFATATQSQSEELDPGLRRDDEVGKG